MKIFNIKLTTPVIFPLIFLFGIIVAMWIALLYIEQNSKKNIHQSLNTVLQTTQEALLQWSESRLDSLAYLASDKEVIDLTKALLDEYRQDKNTLNTSTLNNLRTLMASKIIQYNGHGFFIIAPDRVSIASMRDANTGTENIINRQRKSYLDRAFSGEKVFVPTIYSEIPLTTQSGLLRNKQPTLFIAAPVKDDNSGKVIAVLTIRLNPTDHFTRITKIGRIGKTGETYAFDKEGVLLTLSRFTHDLKSAKLIGDDETGMLSIRITDPGGNILNGHVPRLAMQDRPLTLMAQRAIANDATPYFEPYRDYRGVPVFGAWLWNKTLGIGLTTEIDAKEALLPYTLTRIIIFSVLALIILLTLGLVFLPLWFQEREKKVLIKHRDDLERTVQERTAELEEANNNLKALSEIDPLTQIGNRRFYEHTLAREIAIAKRTSKPLSLLMIDIDSFKSFNDNYGHNHGDRILKEVAQVFARSLTRATDFVARYGGEEFVVILPSTDKEGAYHFAKHIREQIEALAIEHKYSHVANFVTVSIGLSSLSGEALNDTDLFKQADTALYQAKQNGRNQVMIYQTGN